MPGQHVIDYSAFQSFSYQLELCIPLQFFKENIKWTLMHAWFLCSNNQILQHHSKVITYQKLQQYLLEQVQLLELWRSNLEMQIYNFTWSEFVFFFLFGDKQSEWVQKSIVLFIFTTYFWHKVQQLRNIQK